MKQVEVVRPPDLCPLVAAGGEADHHAVAAHLNLVEFPVLSANESMRGRFGVVYFIAKPGEANGDAPGGSFVLCSQEYGVVDSCDAGGTVERRTTKFPSCRSGQGLGSSAPDGAIDLGWTCCESDGVVCALSLNTACQ